MKNFWNHIRNRMLAGLLLLLPLFAIVLVIQKLWKALSGSGHYVAKMLGLKPLLGNASVTVATALLFAILLYFCGWLVKFSALTRVKDWIERKLLQYIPGYLTYKAQLSEKLSPTEDKRIPVWVATNSGKRPGLLITENGDEAIVFFPNSPDSNNGQILSVTKQNITRLNMNAPAFIKSLQKFGKDLSVANS